MGGGDNVCLVDDGEYVPLEEHESDLWAGVQAVLLRVVREQRLHVAQHLLLRVGFLRARDDDIVNFTFALWVGG